MITQNPQAFPTFRRNTGGIALAISTVTILWAGIGLAAYEVFNFKTIQTADTQTPTAATRPPAITSAPVVHLSQ